jgi:hypothetical protein
MREQTDHSAPDASAQDFALYAQGLLASLKKLAIRHDLQLLAHLFDLAAIEAGHHSKRNGPTN